MSQSTGSSKAVSVDVKRGMHLLSLGGLACKVKGSQGFRVVQEVAVYVEYEL